MLAYGLAQRAMNERSPVSGIMALRFLKRTVSEVFIVRPSQIDEVLDPFPVLSF